MVDRGAPEELGAQVCGIVLPANLVQGQSPMAQVLLHPQLANCEVPRSPYACPSTDADSRAAISMEGEIQLKAQVEGKAPQVPLLPP